MKVEFSSTLKKRTIAFCDDELNYHINDSGCANEYNGEILAQLEILYLLGEKDLAEQYKNDYSEVLADLESDSIYRKKEFARMMIRLDGFWDKLVERDSK